MQPGMDPNPTSATHADSAATGLALRGLEFLDWASFMYKRVALAVGLAAAFFGLVPLVAAADLAGQGYQPVQVTNPVGNSIINANNQVGLRATDTDFHYLETGDPVFNAPGPLDEERGWVPGVALTFSAMQDVGVKNLYVSAQLGWSQGHTKYIGAPLIGGGGFGSIVAKTGAIVVDSDFRIGEGFSVGHYAMLTPYLGFGTHYWDRQVNSGEKYGHNYIGAGLMAQVSPFNATVLTGYGLIGRTLGSHISIAAIPTITSGFGSSLGNSIMFKFGASADYALTQQLHLSAGVDTVSYTYGASKPVAVPGGAMNEPDSKTTNTTVNIGLGYGF